MKIEQGNSGIKQQNYRSVLRYILDQGAVSRADIAKALHLSLPTIQQNLRALLERELIVEVGQTHSTGGRKATVFSGNNDAVFSIGIDITRNHVNLVLVGLRGAIVRSQRFELPFRNEQGYYDELSARIESFARGGDGAYERIRFAGFSLPGILSMDKRILTHSYVVNVLNLDCEVFQNTVPWPCMFENDANAAGLAEIRYRTKDATMFYLSLSNSIGGSVFIDGELNLGQSRRCGEIGHMRVIPGGRLCSCGQLGCLDGYCSALQLSNLTDGDLEKFFELLKANDPAILSAWQQYLDVLLLAITNLRMAFDCDIILGGYVGGYLGPWLPQIRARLQELDTFHAPASYVSCCKFTFYASAYGAALQPLNDYILNL